MEETPIQSVPRPRKARKPQPTTTNVFIDTVASNTDELFHNVTVQEAKGTHGDRVVDDAIRTLIDDSHALEACRTHERALPMHLLLKVKHFDKACIVIGGSLRQRDHDIDILQSIFMLLGIANLDMLTVRAVDIKTTCLHATVKSNVYGRISKKLVPYLLRLYPHLSNLVNRDGLITFKVLKKPSMV